ncbi:MAG: HmuY family protein [Myxococcota bacterium]
MTSRNRRYTTVALALLASAALAACGDSLHADPVEPPGAHGKATFTRESGSVTRLLVDATATEAWVHIDLDLGAEVAIDTPAGAAAWDLAFRRSDVKVNGGVSGTGGVEVSETAEAFAQVQSAPSTGWVTDAADAPDDDDDAPDYAFAARSAWYDYDASAHLLSPRATVYALRSSEGGYFALEFLGYYDAAGTSGFPSLRFSAIAPPPSVAPGALSVDASRADTWTYLRLNPPALVAVAAPEASDAWDVAFKRTEIRTNGGTSGGGYGGARLAAAGASFEALTATATTGFAVDTPLPVAGPPGAGEASANPVLNAWYDYDPSTHAVTPKAAFYVVRGAAGDYAKLAIDAFDDGVYALRVASLARDASPVTLHVDASDPERWVAVSLRDAAPVAVDDPASDHSWDLALRRTELRTNGGTSGPGAGGAFSAAAATFDDLGDTSALAFAADAMVPLPGPPGSGESSASPVLSAWYDYDPATHSVTPKPGIFFVRTADGGVAALSITDWADGHFTLQLLYAGAGRHGF